MRAWFLALAVIAPAYAVGAPPISNDTANRALLIGAALGRVEIVEHAGRRLQAILDELDA